MKKSEIIERRDELIRMNHTKYLTEDEHQELHKLSHELICIYASIMDLNEVSDEEVEGLD